MSDIDKAFHRSFKPSWASDGTLAHPSSRLNGKPTHKDTEALAPVVSAGREVNFERVRAIDDAVSRKNLDAQAP